MLFVADGTHCFARKASRDYGKRSHPHFWRISSASHNQAQPNQSRKRQKLSHLWQNAVDTPLVDAVDQKFILLLILNTFSLQWGNMIFSVFIDGIE